MKDVNSLDPALRYKCSRALEGFRAKHNDIEVSEKNIAFYTTLSTLHKGRITAKMFMSYQKVSNKSEVAMGRTFWMHWRSALPEVPPQCQVYLVEERIFPPDLDLNSDDIWLFEEDVPRRPLGRGLMFVKSQTSSARELSPTVNGDAEASEDADDQPKNPALQPRNPAQTPSASKRLPSEVAPPDPENDAKKPKMASEDSVDGKEKDDIGDTGTKVQQKKRQRKGC